MGHELADHIKAGGRGYAQIDPDTLMNPHTWNAALRAAGAVLAATDAVMAGELGRPLGNLTTRCHGRARGRRYGSGRGRPR